MGAFDTIYGKVPCPRCGTLYYLSVQTKFFLPDFSGFYHRAFTVGAPQPIDFDPATLATACTWADQLWRVRAPRVGDELALLAGFDELFTCQCGTALALISDFALTAGPPPSVTLTALRALDARDPNTPAAVDFADAEYIAPWIGDWGAWCAEVAALGAQEPSARQRRLSAALAARFPPRSAMADIPEPWTIIIAPMLCASCGEAAERTVYTLFTHEYLAESFFGPSWTGGLLRLGTRIAVDVTALDDGRDRGAYVRLRPPTGRAELVILERQTSWGCRCGAGQVRPCLHFAIEPGALVLVALEGRVVREAADLDEIDFASAPLLTGALAPPGSSRPPSTALDRAERVRRLLTDGAS